MLRFEEEIGFGFDAVVRLKQNMIDHVQRDASFFSSNGFQKAGKDYILSLSEDSIATFNDEFERVVINDIVGKINQIKSWKDELTDIVGAESGNDDRISNPGLDIAVFSEVDLLKQMRLPDEDNIRVFGEILKEEPEPAEVFHIHQMGIVDDQEDGFTWSVKFESFRDEVFLTLEERSFKVGFKSLAKDLDSVDIGVKGSRNGNNDGVFVSKGENRLFDDGFSSTGLTHEETKTAMSGMDFNGIIDNLLVFEKREVVWEKGNFFNTEIGVNHVGPPEDYFYRRESFFWDHFQWGWVF
jgi:hypothetical protein